MTSQDWAGQDWVGADFQRLPDDGSVALCGACRRLGHCRFGLGREELGDDGVVVTELVCGEENEGGPDVAHGGWTASVFDEMLGHLPLLHGQLAVTGQLSLTYLKPVPLNRPLVGRAWKQREQGRRWYVEGELKLAGTGAVLARGTAVMVLRDNDHFTRHQAWLAEQDALGAGPDPQQQQEQAEEQAEAEHLSDPTTALHDVQRDSVARTATTT